MFTGPAYGQPEDPEEKNPTKEPKAAPQYSENEFVEMVLQGPLGQFIGGTAKTVNDIIDFLTNSNIFERGPSLGDKINEIPNKPGSFTGKKSTILGGQ